MLTYVKVLSDSSLIGIFNIVRYVILFNEVISLTRIFFYNFFVLPQNKGILVLQRKSYRNNSFLFEVFF